MSEDPNDSEIELPSEGPEEGKMGKSSLLEFKNPIPESLADTLLLRMTKELFPKGK